MPDQPQQVQIQFPTEWVESDSPVYFANAFAVQPVKDEFVLTFGTIEMPILARAFTPEDAKTLKIKIRPCARIGMTPGRIIELIDFLQKQIKAYSDTLDRQPN